MTVYALISPHLALVRVGGGWRVRVSCVTVACFFFSLTLSLHLLLHTSEGTHKALNPANLSFL